MTQFPRYNIRLSTLYEWFAQEECEELGMGGYLGVQQGSKFPPRFVHLTYKPENPTADVVKVALVGKGLTFDR
jgi:leucyl aminopeptidase